MTIYRCRFDIKVILILRWLLSDDSKDCIALFKLFHLIFTRR